MGSVELLNGIRCGPACAVDSNTRGPPEGRRAERLHAVAGLWCTLAPMSIVKLLKNKDLVKLEREINAALADAPLEFHSITLGPGAFIAVLVSKAQPSPSKAAPRQTKPSKR